MFIKIKAYKVIKDFHPVVTKKGDIKEHTAKPVVRAGDILIQMGDGDTRFKSMLDKNYATYEYILREHKDIFEPTIAHIDQYIINAFAETIKQQNKEWEDQFYGEEVI